MNTGKIEDSQINLNTSDEKVEFTNILNPPKMENGELQIYV